MALTRLGLGGVLTFEERQAVSAMGKATSAFKRLEMLTNRLPAAMTRMGMRVRTAMLVVTASARRLGRGLNLIGAGLGRVAMAGIPFAFAMLKGAKSAASFEQAMADLGAVARASDKDMGRLTAKAKEMGIVTAFSASQSAQAMEMLARAGATVEEQISGVKGVLDAAAAGGIHYAEASEIVAGVTRGMGREFAKAGELANILALATTKAAPDMRELGEAFRYSMAQARIMGISTEELTAILGKLGDATLKGSMGGTSLNIMLSKLAKPSKTAQKLMKQWGISITDATGRMKPLSTIVQSVSKRLDAVKDAAKRARIMTDLFSERGKKAYAALAVAGKESIDTLTEELRRASDGVGAATDIAQRRLGTLMGAFKLLSASVEGISIELYGPVLDSVTGFVKEATSGVNNVLFAMQDLRAEQAKHPLTIRDVEAAEKKHGTTAVAVAFGIMDTIDWMKEKWEGLIETVKKFGSWMTRSGKQGTRAMVALTGKIVMTVAVAAPLLLLLKGMTWTLGGMIPIIKGVGIAFKAALGPIGWVLAGVVLLLTVIKRENEGLLGVVGRVWGAIRDTVAAVIQDIINFFRPIVSAIGEVLSAVNKLFRTLFGQLWSDTEATTSNMGGAFRQFGALVGKVIGYVLQGLAKVIEWLDSAIEKSRSALEEGISYVHEYGTKALGAIGIVSEETEKRQLRMARGARQLIRQERRARAIALREEKARLAEMMRLGKAETAGRIGEAARRAAKAEQIGEMSAEAAAAGARAEHRAEITRRRGIEAAEAARGAVAGRAIDINIQNTVDIDGRQVSQRMAKTQQEIQERAGFKTTPWQKRMILEHGAMPATAAVRSY